jgi:hypothetical protein
MMFQAQIPIGSLPINLVLVGNQHKGAVVFVVVAPINNIVYDEGTVSAAIDYQGFTLDDGDEYENFVYNTVYEYKSIPLMLKWLQQQNLQVPQNIMFA